MGEDGRHSYKEILQCILSTIRVLVMKTPRPAHTIQYQKPARKNVEKKTLVRKTEFATFVRRVARFAGSFQS